MAAKLVAVGKRVGEKLVPVGIRLVYSSVAKGQTPDKAIARKSSVILMFDNDTKETFYWSMEKGAIFWKYAKVEWKPPTFSEMPEVSNRFQQIVKAAQTKKWKQMPVQEAWINTLVCLEILFIFCIGEIFGKGNLIGYKIKGCYKDQLFDPGYTIH